MKFNGPTIITGINDDCTFRNNLYDIYLLCEKYNYSINFFSCVNYQSLSNDLIKFLIDNITDESILIKNYKKVIDYHSVPVFKMNILYSYDRIEKVSYENVERLILPLWLRKLNSNGSVSNHEFKEQII